MKATVATLETVAGLGTLFTRQATSDQVHYEKVNLEVTRHTFSLRYQSGLPHTKTRQILRIGGKHPTSVGSVSRASRMLVSWTRDSILGPGLIGYSMHSRRLVQLERVFQTSRECYSNFEKMGDGLSRLSI